MIKKKKKEEEIKFNSQGYFELKRRTFTTIHSREIESWMIFERVKKNSSLSTIPEIPISLMSGPDQSVSPASSKQSKILIAD